MGKNNQRKTTDQFIAELKNIQPNIIVVGQYVNNKTNIEMHCKIHNIDFKQIPSKALIGQCGCPICAVIKGKRYKKTHRQFVQEMKNINHNIEILGYYNGGNKKIRCKCAQCGTEWSAIPNNLLQGKGCSICGNKRQGKIKTKTNEQFLSELKEITTTIIPLENYRGALEKIRVRCIECQREWDVSPHSLLRGTGCLCGCMSYGEKMISQYLTNHSISFNYQQTFDSLNGVGNQPLSYDFYLPIYNLLIEYQGQFHDGTAFQQTETDYLRQQEHDKRKRMYAKNHNIPLLEIWYWDYENIEEILDNILHIPVTTIAV